MGEMRNAYDILVGKAGGKIRCGRSGCRGEYNIRLDLREIGWEVMDWMHLAQDRNQWQVLVNTVMNFEVL
jgi:hypothetical protein